ncbi:AAA family ATPase [Burkholderia cepacia]|uniref:ATP-binding protein n=1 Tax=Burkholderia cepacia TaxID=292 RepID=A0A8I1ATX7_BURCE|nr:AAA family ATPase [Burkholderia cepacia]MBA9900922.1 ATP-binding protein [Burkholderia cepacia]MBA9947888.1 ATP-binding protein [Burkholderia cepacia]MBA9978134.1 ATP-binding protein [Burkholderia cepacia]MBA9996931.1 ATP-binding protein [Burkholderia cepacia]MBB0004698.1 ATP-binding protein [Burkholderia cepacia]
MDSVREADATQAPEDALFDCLLQGIETSLQSGSGPHFTYIIGNNGTGKSRQLAKIAGHFTGEHDTPQIIGCISNAVYDRFTLTTRGQIEYLGARTSGNAVFHAAIDRQLSKIILKGILRNKSVVRRLEQTLEMDFMFSIRSPEGGKIDFQKLVDRRKLKGSPISAFLSRDERELVSEFFGRQFRFSRLSREQATAIQKFLELNPDVRIFVRRRDRAHSMIDFDQLSTGEQNRALTYAKVLSVAQEAALILIDEPEISLHLHWQMGFHKSLCEILDGYRRYHVVIATHSPVIISEGAKHNSEDARVVVLERELHKDTSRLTFRHHKFGDVPSHERLVLRDFSTATYHTAAVNVEIAESVLNAIEQPEEIGHIVDRLESMSTTLGLSDEDEKNIQAAIRIVRKHVPTINAEDNEQ